MADTTALVDDQRKLHAAAGIKISRAHKYRPDIDALRAFAVLPVVLFHAGVAGFSGGYVGVDVFFVISGYLISSILLREISAGHFSLISFYERRTRRIFPALFVMVLAVALCAVVFLPPNNVADIGKTALFTMIFGSNILFSTKTGYFDKDTVSNPLLHTWSLGVEEQFYIFVPLIIYFTFRVSQKRLVLGGVLIALFVVSLFMSIFGAALAPIASFYLIPFRAWELLTGTLLAFFNFPKPRSRWGSEVLCWLGLTLLAIAIFGFDEATPFPSFWAAVPCLGAAILIYAGDQPTLFVGRVLRWKPLIAVGLISYSLYLWHWPIIVFSQFYHFTEVSFGEKALIVGASLVFGWVSWRYVEKPVRSGRFWSQSNLFLAAGAGSAVIMVAGAGLAATHGFPQRFPGISYNWSTGDRVSCLYGAKGRSLKDIESGNLCPLGKAGLASFVLWGDSHAEALRPTIDLAAKKVQVSGVFAGYASCGPMLDLGSRNVGQAVGCREFNDQVLRYVSTHSVQTVILSARWVTKFDGSWRLPPGRSGFGRDDADDAYVSLVQTALRLRSIGKRVVIVAQPVEAGFVVPRALFRYGKAQDQLDELRPRPGSALAARAANRLALAAAKESGADFVDLNDALCSRGECKVFYAGEPLFYDEHHISSASAPRLAPLFEDLLREKRRAAIEVH